MRWTLGTRPMKPIAVRPPRRHRSAEDAAVLVADWQSSGQNKSTGVGAVIGSDSWSSAWMASGGQGREWRGRFFYQSVGPMQPKPHLIRSIPTYTWV